MPSIFQRDWGAKATSTSRFDQILRDAKNFTITAFYMEGVLVRLDSESPRDDGGSAGGGRLSTTLHDSTLENGSEPHESERGLEKLGTSLRSATESTWIYPRDYTSS